MNTDQWIGEQVLIRMRRRGVDQQQLGQVIGLAQTNVSKRLKGITHWRMAEIIAAADYLECSVDELMPPITVVLCELGPKTEMASPNGLAESRCTVPPDQRMPYLLAHVA